MRATSRGLPRRRVVASGKGGGKGNGKNGKPKAKAKAKAKAKSKAGAKPPALCVRSLQRTAPAGRVPTVTWFTPLPLSEATSR